MYALLKDFRFGFRSLVQRPGVSVVAVLSLGVGVGVTSTAFSLINAMALRDLPGIEAQDRLVALGITLEREPGVRISTGFLAWPDVEVFQSRVELFEAVAAAGPAEVAFRWGGEPVVEEAEVVTDNYFRVLGTRPFRGRFLDETDEVPGLASAVIAHRVYESMGSPSDVVGRQVDVNGRPFTVVGVAPPHFTGMVPGDVVEGGTGPGLWVSLAEAARVRPRWVGEDVRVPEARWLRVVARLRDGVTAERLAAGLPAAATALERTLPGYRDGVRVIHGGLQFGPGAGHHPVLLLSAFMVVPLLVLLIACANAANLLLARTTERREELAIRSALGAGRSTLIRQLLAESVILALAAGALGLVVALWSRSIAGLFAIHLSMEAPLDLRLFAFTFVSAVIAGLGLGLLPALSASRPDLMAVVAGSARTTASRGSVRLRRGLVVAQVALSVVLLLAAGLFIRSARHGLTIPTGFEENGLVLVTLDLDILRYDPMEGRALYEELLERVRSLPEVNAAALADLPPLDGLPYGPVALPGLEAEYGRKVALAYVGSGYFAAAGIPLLAGREARTDGAGGPEVVVSRKLAERLWPEADPLGQPLRVGSGDGGELHTVVGVAGEARARIHSEPAPVLYLPRRHYLPLATLYARSSDPARTVAAIRDVVRGLDPRLPLHAVDSARDVRERQLLPWRLMAVGLGSLGAIALALALAGLYGVISFSVAGRTREIGVRVALGADRLGVITMVLRESLSLVALGGAIGVLLGIPVGQLLRSLLFGVSPLDPVTWLSLLGLLLVVGSLAGLIPARRAAAIEPARALAEP